MWHLRATPPAKPGHTWRPQQFLKRLFCSGNTQRFLWDRERWLYPPVADGSYRELNCRTLPDWKRPFLPRSEAEPLRRFRGGRFASQSAAQVRGCDKGVVPGHRQHAAAEAEQRREIDEDGRGGDRGTRLTRAAGWPFGGCPASARFQAWENAATRSALCISHPLLIGA